MHSHNTSRRAFLRRAAVLSGSVGSAGLPFALNMLALGSAAAQSSDYKAIVCLFLYGGNDAANMVLATDTPSWNEYVAARSQNPDPIALRPAGTAPNGGAAAASPAALGGVLPIEPARSVHPENATRQFALHPSMPEVQALFEQGRLGVLANAGPLIEPVEGRPAYQSNRVRKPAKLFSHNDQQSTWQALAPEGARVGWGGRLGDLVASTNGQTVFTSISAAGNAVFMAGNSVFQYQVSGNGATAIGGLTGNLFGSAEAGQIFRSLITADNQHLFAKEYANITRRSVEAQAMFQTAFAATADAVPEPGNWFQPSTRTEVGGNSLANQLRTVARIISARGELGVQRQVFFVSLGGFDTHGGQNVSHANLMARLSHALGYFDQQLGTLGLRDRVTLFTASDFGRTFISNGDGTDHGWGAHHFVYGGAVRGREVYGRFPQLGRDHDDATNRSGSFIPGISVDQVGATLGRWFGVGESSLDLVFPNLRNFSSRDLGFYV